MQMPVLIVALLAREEVLTKEHHDEMPLKTHAAVRRRLNQGN